MTTQAIPGGSHLDVEIGERVYMLLFRQHKTQAVLGKALGLNQAGIARRLRGETGWKATDLARTADELQTTIAYLVGEVGDPVVHPLGLEPRTHWYRADEDVVIPIEWAFELREQRERRLEQVIA